jgi:hypothetical protein
LENGEAFLPDLPPEEAALVLAEPLPEPAPPDLPEPPPELAEETSLEEPPPEEPSGEGPPEGPPAELAEEAPLGEPPPELPPPPPRIVRPSEPVPPPPPARELVPMPPQTVPDLPARNPPTLTPAPEPSGVSSRLVRALVGQTVEVPFRGTGWVYLGEASSKRGLDYGSRRLDPEGQTFVFRAEEAGVYALKFYRQDFIRDYIINDAVTVIVEEPPLSEPPSRRPGPAPDPGVAVAEPRWPALAGPAKPETGSGAPAAGPSAAPAGEPAGTVAPERAAAAAARTRPDPQGADTEAPAAEPALTGDTDAEEYLRRAREEYQEERYPQAAALLDQFLERFPLGSDEAYWLYAQICEKQGPSRNIRLALDYYRRLVAGYPQSSHYNNARRRIAYLERYYINIQ